MGEKKRILFVIASLCEGGAERVVCLLTKYFVKAGFETGIVLTYTDEKKYFPDKEVRLYNLNCKQDNNLSVFKRYSLRRKKIKKAIEEFNPDVVISFIVETNMDVCGALRNSKVPVIVSERNDPNLSPPGRIKKILRNALYKRANGFVFQTNDARAYFSKKIQSRSCVILNPVTDELPEIWHGERTKRAVAVGRLHKQKNYDMLIQAYKMFSERFPDYKLDIYGDGALKKQIQEKIDGAGLKDKITLNGFCTDVHGKIRDAAFFVMSSDYEGLPNALLEAMCLGLPCISTDCPCGGPRMLIDDKVNGLLVPVNNAEKTAEAMIFMAENPEIAAQMGANAVKIKEKTNADEIARQWIDYILKFIK